MVVTKLAPSLDPVKRRVPSHGLSHAGHVPHDELVEALADVALPARHRGDERLHRGVAIPFRDLRVAAREEDDLALSRLLDAGARARGFAFALRLRLRFFRSLFMTACYQRFSWVIWMRLPQVSFTVAMIEPGSPRSAAS